MPFTDRVYTLEEADRIIKNEARVPQRSLQDWTLLVIKELQGSLRTPEDIQDVVNKIFLIYMETMRIGAAPLRFKRVRGGVYSEEIEDTLESLLLGKYIEAHESEAKETVNMILTDKGYSVATTIMSTEDYPLES